MKLKFPYAAPLFLLVCLGGTIWWVLRDHSGNDQKEPEVQESPATTSGSYDSVNVAKLDGGSHEVTPKPYTRISRANIRLDNQVMAVSGETGTDQVEPIEAANEIGQVVALDKDGLTVKERVKLLEGLNGLSQEEIEELMKFVKAGEIPEGMRASSYHWLVDEMFQTSRRSTRNPKELTNDLAEIASNTETDLVVRDYAIQHLGHLLHEGGEAGIIKEALLLGTLETQGSIAGTSLLALQVIDNNETLRNRAYSIVADRNYSTASRVTAFNIVSKYSSIDIRSLAKNVLQDKNTSQHLKIIAQSIVEKKLDKN